MILTEESSDEEEITITPPPESYSSDSDSEPSQPVQPVTLPVHSVRPSVISSTGAKPKIPPKVKLLQWLINS